MSTFTPRRVLHAAENIKGGVGTYLRDLLVMQRAHYGNGVVVAVVPETQAEILKAPEGVEIVTFDNRGPRWLSTLRLARTMREWVERTDPDVIHLHSTFAGLALRPLLRWMRMRGAVQAPVIYCAHGWSFDRDTSFLSRRLAAWLERTLAPLCDAIVCISAHELRLANEAGISGDSVVQITNGVPRDAPTPAAPGPAVEWPAGKRRVLFVGRFDRQKGVDVLLDAMSRMQVSSFGWLVGERVLGDGEELKFPPNVRSTGWLSAAEISAYYESAEVLVVPSRWEGFGLIAVEGMRAGLPVIATRAGGLPEIVENGVTGLLIEPGRPDAIADAVRSLSDETRARMGKAGRARFEAQFTLDRVHQQLTALYQRLLDAHRSGFAAVSTPAAEGQPEGAPNA
jgi:glycosyltransferase involved in cell wall biosynthesis